MRLTNLILLNILLMILLAAGLAQGFAGCMSSPCNCFCSKHNETWDGEDRSHTTNCLCPPYNRGGGRNGCLKKFGFPAPFHPFVRNYCAEESPSQDYFDPQIRVRMQICNILFCWDKVANLSWNGQCAVTGGNYGLPLNRICARIAVPSERANMTEEEIKEFEQDGKSFYPADPGYNPYHSLNFEGALKKDELLKDDDGNVIELQMPKICAYDDPDITYSILAMAVGAAAGPAGMIAAAAVTDIFDYDPTKQITHNTEGEVNIIVQIIIFLIKFGEPGFDMMMSLSESFLKAINLDFIADINAAIASLVMVIGDFIVEVLEWIGNVNKFVIADLGCVQIPLGPYPPPYCPELRNIFPKAKITQICFQKEGAPSDRISSTYDNPCAVSNLHNNIIHNSVRIGFDKIYQICDPETDPEEDEKCITLNINGNVVGGINGTETILPGIMNSMTGEKNLIRNCTSGDSLCVQTKFGTPCSVTSNGCNNGFRIVFAQRTYAGTAQNKQGEMTTNFDYRILKNYASDLPPCSLESNSSCQVVYGVNFGEFQDIAMTFPTLEYSYNDTLIEQTLSLNDPNQLKRDLRILLPRKNTEVEGFRYDLNPKEICALEENNVLGCVPRPIDLLPEIFECDSPSSQLSCTSTHFEPMAVLQLKSGDDYTQGRVKVPTVRDPDGSTPASTKINLAGLDYQIFATDDQMTKAPFGLPSPPYDAGALYGEYTDPGQPLNSDGTSTNATYIKGLEFYRNRYSVGATKVCAEPYNITECASDKTNCVLSKILKSDLVDCRAYQRLEHKYPRLYKCKGDENYCDPEESINGIDGTENSLVVRKCVGDEYETNYCYSTINDDTVCETSRAPEDRIFPAYNGEGSEFLAQNEYYDRSNPEHNMSGCSTGQGSAEEINDELLACAGSSYDASKSFIRDKTSLERGLCIAAPPPPSCDAINTPSPSTGNATWAASPGGEKAPGTCKTGFQPASDPLERYCLIDRENQFAYFEPNNETNICGKLCSFNYINNTIDNSGGGEGANVWTENINENTTGLFFRTNPSNIYNDMQVTINFNIGHPDTIDYFNVTRIMHDDVFAIKVNDKYVLAVAKNGHWYPDNVTDVTRTNHETIRITDEHGEHYSVGDTDGNITHHPNNFNLKPHLSIGNNKIVIQFFPVDYGRVHMDFEIRKNCE